MTAPIKVASAPKAKVANKVASAVMKTKAVAEVAGEEDVADVAVAVVKEDKTVKVAAKVTASPSIKAQNAIPLTPAPRRIVPPIPNRTVVATNPTVPKTPRIANSPKIANQAATLISRTANPRARNAAPSIVTTVSAPPTRKAMTTPHRKRVKTPEPPCATKPPPTAAMTAAPVTSPIATKATSEVATSPTTATVATTVKLKTARKIAATLVTPPIVQRPSMLPILPKVASKVAASANPAVNKAAPAATAASVAAPQPVSIAAVPIGINST